MSQGTYSIIAATCYGNRGAQAMLETVVGRLSRERPGLRFNAFSYYPDEDRRLVADPRVTIYSSTPAALVLWLLPWSLLFGAARWILGRRVLRLAPAAIRALGDSKALVDVAGVSFIDGREKFLPFNVLTIFPAWLLGVPVVKLSQAMGPFEGFANRLAARCFLPMCRMVWARGERTFEHLSRAAFPRVRFAQADDIAFNHEAAYSLTSEDGGGAEHLAALMADARNHPGIRGLVGVCPSSVVAAKARSGDGAYEPALVELIRGLADRGLAVVLFPNATRASAGDAERNNDLPLIRRIAAAAARAGCAPVPVIIDRDLNASAIKQVIAMTDVVVVSRFHAMVGALSIGVPPAVLGWSHKYAEVMARFGLEANVLDYKQLAGADLLERACRLFEERGAAQGQIREHLPSVKASAERPVLGLLSPSLGVDLA